ncbi:MAG TPA: S8 family serine peptidase [Gemmatimonadales bacterium]|nr:S8 family serine peptidase [Gemmatimonadales bacterium]
MIRFALRAAFVSLALAGACVLPVAAQTPVTAPGQAGGLGQRSMSPTEAFARGLMPLHSTGVDRFAAAHPSWDGRGVLIAILDSGIDPGVAGLGLASDSTPKILDLRDFSHEGDVALHQVQRRGDTLIVAGHRLLGASHVAAIAGRGAIWGGALLELPLGPSPQADVDGNGQVGDTLPVVVVRGSDGWVLFADTQENGTLADDKPVHDFAVAHEFFGWSTAGHPHPVNVAANFADSAGTPHLDLFFDTDSHGTHVSGIAAGHDIYGVRGFDGVAPGAHLIGLKIANDAAGGVTVSGSMVKALDYAIHFAHDRGMPLVVNLSFGVGNEIEGTARVDGMIDSLLAAHPDVVMMVAASNDGPGLSTIGFPASASRVVAVGATAPLVFAGVPPGDALAEPLASFSSRGGEEAAPDIVVPGSAYSTIPNFAIGNEQEDGTSMASPHAAGLAARLISAAKANGRTVTAHDIKQALQQGSHLLPSASVVDQGAGMPDLTAAWAWLSTSHNVPDLAVDIGAVHGRGGVLEFGAPKAGGDSITLRRLDGDAPITLQLASADPWVTVPASVTLVGGKATFVATITGADPSPDVRSTVIKAMGPDASVGPLATIPVTQVAPLAVLDAVPHTVRMGPGAVRRFFVPADTGRGVQIQVATLQSADHVMAMLAEPGGMPFRDGPEIPAGFGDGAALLDIGGDDVVRGLYEVDVAAGPLAADSATVTVHQSPVRLGAALSHDTLSVTAQSLVASAAAFRFRAGLIGAEQRLTITRSNDAPIRVALAMPAWAAHVAVDMQMPRAQWSRFTDFGFVFQDRNGKQLATSPVNYAFSRAAPDLPARLPGDSLILLLEPAFATPTADGAWSVDLVIHFYLTKPVALDNGGSESHSIEPGATYAEHFAGAHLPMDLPPELRPLVIAVALEGEERAWSRQVVVARPAGAGQ